MDVAQHIGTPRTAARPRRVHPVPCIVLAAALCTVFAVDPQAGYGIVTGKVFLLHMLSPVCAVLSAAVVLSRRGRTRFFLRLQPVDAVMGGLLLLLAVTYRWKLNAEPVKMLFAGQWIVWWVLLRHFAADRRFRRFAVYALAATALGETVVGLCQIYGLIPPLHRQYPLTGTFYNPGPLAGLLALIMPVMLHRIRRLGQLRHTHLIRRTRRLNIAYGFLLASFGLSAAVLPATMSRIAWIAAAVSCAVVWMADDRRLRDRIRKFLAQRQTVVKMTAVFLCLALTASGLYFLKTDSANGRLWMGYISLRVMAHHPSGVGLGGFPAAYAEEQAGYFARHTASPAIVRVAGNPAYAFNEYLQCGVELGWAGLALMAAGLFLALRKSRRNGRYGWYGVLLALAVFAVASYPLQLPSFWILLVIAGNMAIAGNNAASRPCAASRTCAEELKNSLQEPGPSARTGSQRGYYIRLTGWGLLILLSVACTAGQQDTRKAYRAWTQIIRADAADDSSRPSDYQDLYTRLRHEPAFLFSYAKASNRQKDYAGADSLLQRASQLSSDPMIWNVWGRNAWEQGAYEQAEQRLIRASQMVPSRMYPYYLLTKLYADPAYFHPDQLEETARIVLEMKPKIVSPAIREMQEEIAALMTSFLLDEAVPPGTGR